MRLGVSCDSISCKLADPLLDHDPSRFKASPVGLTIALGRLEEEKAYHVLKVVEAALANAKVGDR